MKTPCMKSIEVKLSVKGLAGIIIADPTKADSTTAKAFFRVVHDGKLYATSSFSMPLKMSPAEKANAKINRYVAIWNDDDNGGEQPLVFEAAPGNVLELQICLRLQNGKQFQIGAGSVRMPADGAADLNIREVRQNFSSPYRIDPNGDARLRIHATSEEKETGVEINNSKAVTASSSFSSCVSFEQSGIEVSSVRTSEVCVEASEEPHLQPTRPDPANCEDSSLEPSVEQVFIPENQEEQETDEKKKKKKKKQSPLVKWMKRANVMDWSRKKKNNNNDQPPNKPLKLESGQTNSKKTESTAQMQKDKKISSKKNKTTAQTLKEKKASPKKTIATAQILKEKETSPKKTIATAQVLTEKEASPGKTKATAQIQKEKEASFKKTIAPPQMQREKEAGTKKIESTAQMKKEKETYAEKESTAQMQKEKEEYTKEIESIAQIMHKQKETRMHSFSSEKTEKVGQVHGKKNESPQMDAIVFDSAFDSAWTPSESSAFVSLQKKAALVSPDSPSSFTTAKTANSTPCSVVRQQEDNELFAARGGEDIVIESPQDFVVKKLKSDFHSRRDEGFEEFDFASFPAPESPLACSEQPTCVISSPDLLESHQQNEDNGKEDAFQQGHESIPLSPEPDLPIERRREDEVHHRSFEKQNSIRKQPPPAPEKRMPKMDLDEHSLFSGDDDSTFLAKPRQLFGLIKCCIMGDEDSIYGYDEAMTFDDTLGEDTTINSYDDTYASDIPLNNWLCQEAFGRPQPPHIIRKRQIWKERMQQLSEKNGPVKELFGSQSESDSEPDGSFDNDDDDDETEAGVTEEKLNQGRAVPSDKQDRGSVGSHNSETFGPSVMRTKIESRE